MNLNRPSKPDFPYYNGRPVGLSASQWWLVMAAVVVALAVLVAPIPLFASAAGHFIPVILYPIIPLFVLARVAGEHWKALFRIPRLKDYFMMIGFAVLNLAVTIIVGVLASQFFGAVANPAVAGMAEQGAGQRLAFFIAAMPQLLGEEIMTILPFLAIMTFCFGRLNWSRRSAILSAWLISAVLFGLAHLPSYNWNMIQCLLVIGTARLILTLPYLITRNIWVSTGAHIFNDWMIFGMSLLGAMRATG